MPIDPNIILGGMRPPSNDSPFTYLAGLMQAREAGQRIRSNQMLLEENAEKLRKLQEQREDAAAINESIRRHAGGLSNPDDLDLNSVIYDLQRQGRGSAAITFQGNVYDARKKQVDELKTRTEATEQRIKLASQIASGITDEASFARAVPQITSLVGPDMAKTLGDRYDPAVVKQAVSNGRTAADNIAALKLGYERADKAIEASRNAVTDTRSWAEKTPKIVQEWTNAASGVLSTAKNQQDWQTGLTMLNAGIAILPLDVRAAITTQFPTEYSEEAVERARLLGMTQAQRSEEASRKATNKMERDKMEAADDIPMSDAAIELRARTAAMTGDPGAFGMGNQARNDRNRVWNRAGEIYKGLDLPSQIAAWRANQQSLRTMQPQYDALVAFENNELKNLRVFMESASKVVDTGSPWINKPFRAAARDVFGSENMATYDTARTLVVPGFARIIGNANLSSNGVVSDSQRGELDKILHSDYTYKQLFDAAKVLVTDSENRRTSLSDQLNEIKRRIATPPPGTTKVDNPDPGDGGPTSSGIVLGAPKVGQLPANYDGFATQNGTRFHIKADSQGNMILHEPAPLPPAQPIAPPAAPVAPPVAPPVGPTAPVPPPGGRGGVPAPGPGGGLVPPPPPPAAPPVAAVRPPVASAPLTSPAAAARQVAAAVGGGAPPQAAPAPLPVGAPPVQQPPLGGRGIPPPPTPPGFAAPPAFGTRPISTVPTKLEGGPIGASAIEKGRETAAKQAAAKVDVPVAPKPVVGIPKVLATMPSASSAMPDQFGYNDPAYAPAKPEEVELFSTKINNVIDKMKTLGYDVVITERARTDARQMALFLAGKSELDGVDKKSSHQLDLGADFAFIKNGKPSYAEDMPWELLGRVIQDQGLVWGGTWKTLVDRPHGQLRPIATPPDAARRP